ncbi:RNA 3'-terminal phosphate cyclase [Neocloeon triangulifer]|uniref:RNA 3'-terminal phosphate cyclase n=1 Tax=Neocloeon triangulifer TaxID=2078957 RepID=UPI00286F32D4|nr:RNA 3'-terminal phosphate cyclase [Neocloeon triangulifer]
MSAQQENQNIGTRISDNAKMVVIDGSILEGGGQILRISVALSAIKRIPVQIKNIRLGRKKPGLAEQHLKGIMLVRDMCNGVLQNGHVGSTEITFHPGELTSGTFTSKISTAGSIALLMQIAIPCALFAPGPCNFNLYGGTDADMAPPVDYMKLVTTELLSKFGAELETKVIKRGFFPKGGGEVHVSVQNAKEGLRPVSLTNPGVLESLTGVAIVGGSCPMKVANDMKKGAENVLLEKFSIRPNISVQQCPSFCPGSSLLVVGKSSTGCIYGVSVIGSRSRVALQQGEQVAIELAEIDPDHSCVDSYAQDQIILPMALANGTSTVICGPLTLHTQTAIEIVKQLSNAKFQIEELSEKVFKITCVGDPPAL